MDGSNHNIKIDITADASGLNTGTTEASAKLNQLTASFDKTAAAARAVNDPINAVEASSNKLSAGLSRLPGIGLGVGGLLVATAAGAYAMARGAIEAADALQTMHLQTGIAVEQLAAWDVVTKKSSTTLGSLTQGLKNASNYLVDHADRLRAMGIQAKTSEEVLFKVSEIIARLPVDDPRRMALAMDVFGKSAQDLLPLLSEGEVKLRAMLERGKELNPVTAKMAEEANLFNSHLVEFNMLGKQFGLTIANEMLPELNTLLEQLLEGQKIAGGFWNALLLFGTTNPFRTPTENIRAYKEEIAGLEEDRARFLKFGASTDSIDTVIAGLQKKIKFVEVLQRQGMADINKLADEQQQALMKKMNAQNYLAAIDFAKQRNGGVLTQDAALNIGRQAYPEEFIQLGKIDKPDKVKTGRRARVAADPYIAFSKQMDERAALLNAQGNQQDKLTATEQYAVKVMEDLRNGSLKLTEAQAIDTAGKLEWMLAQDSYNVSLLAANKAQDESNTIIDRARSTSSEYLKQLQFENSLIGKSAQDIQLLTEKRRIDLAMEKELLALRSNDKFSGRDTNPAVAANYQRAVEEIKAVAEASKAGAEVEIESRNRVTRAWEAGTDTAVRNYLDAISNAAKQSEKLVTDSFRGMEDALAKYVRTGKLDFSSLADSIINNLIRIEIQKSIMQPIASAMGGSDLLSGLGSLLGLGGGSAPASAPVGDYSLSSGGSSFGLKLPSYAVGTDYVPRDMIAQIHEGEQIVPKAYNPAAGNGAGTVLQVNIVNNASGQVSATAQPNSSGGFDLLIEQIEGGIARNVQRGTGALNGALSQTFGLNRAPGAF